MLRRFLKDVRGNYAMMMVVAMVPIMGAVAISVDYSQMVRQRQVTLQALDAAGIATARRAVEGATDAELMAYAKDFFEANLSGIDPALVTLSVVLPNSSAGGGTLKMSATVDYNPLFLPAFASLIGSNFDGAGTLDFDAQTEVRLKNTLEVALVLDNSGSMDFNGSGTGKKRLVLLKEAAKQLVDTIALQAGQMKQVDKPVQFSVVPFAASVNVGTNNATASWMDTDGRSPVHHENFDWTTMSSGNTRVEFSGGVYRKAGEGWGPQENQIVTRFTMFDDLKRITGYQQVQTGTTTQETCSGSGRNRNCTTTIVPVYEDQPVLASYASWAGCVETRPYPYAYANTSPSQNAPASLFVPMFAPDETDAHDGANRPARGNWWSDGSASGTHAQRQAFMPKYFVPAENKAAVGSYAGPNGMCSTTPITPLTDISTAAGLKKVKDSIDAMVALGATDIPEGTAWGWRTVSSKAPFTEGRPDHEMGNDKVVIVLTDGFNTYYTPNSLGYNDLADNKSIYSNQGYTGRGYDGSTTTRIFMNTSVNKGTHTNANFTSAMNQHLDSVCEQAKAAGVILMTVALDLTTSNKDEREAIEAMTRCASESRFRRDPNDPSKAAKLFWNANGSNLADKFKEIADELSNLRIVG